MSERVLKCPRCNAPLPPTRFARAVTCSYCGASVQVDPTAVFASKFRAAYETWNQGGALGGGVRLSIGNAHWRLGPLVAHGDASDVFFAERDRWPTERVLLKILRDPQDLPLLEAEWDSLTMLHACLAGSPGLGSRIPFPAARGAIAHGAHVGRHALALQWAPGFRHTFESVRRVHAAGIEPRASIWVWRRILEVLSALHRAGYAHGAVLPPHLLVEDHEHGVRLVGYSCAGLLEGTALRAIFTRFERFYAPRLLRSQRLAAAHDVTMSARCLAYLLGGEPDGSGLPRAVPPALAQTIQDVARGDEAGPTTEAWTLREQLGTLATELFGPPAFVPIVMPD